MRQRCNANDGDIPAHGLLSGIRAAGLDASAPMDVYVSLRDERTTACDRLYSSVAESLAEIALLTGCLLQPLEAYQLIRNIP
ncbi:hypothetical protein [Sinorhizobium psoraleae]|uniref:Uncharacterized protein n=1 Tax=Sinorhizobium psoraleae TaxID=520838 RepID=A0ABT4KP69_9HYPH|nr:hypothetical protein [Sinorhizobium psoraleae]MCZ4093738.1 hypothetical protein [Sinorhizobium psoraleae]